MDPTTTVATMLAGLTSATQLAKTVHESSKVMEKAEHRLQLAELITALADAKIAASEVVTLIAETSAENQRLKEALAVKGKIKYEEPYYWVVDGEDKSGPYCQACYDKANALIRLQDMRNGAWVCEVCKTTFLDKSHRRAQPRAGGRTIMRLPDHF